VLELLDTHSSFLFAVLVLTWGAMALLLLMVIHLHTRIQRLEQAEGAANPTVSPYSRLLGRSVRDIVRPNDFAADVRVLLLLSSTCRSCRKLLDELPAILGTDATCMLAWVDGATPPSTVLPRGVFVLENGPAIAATLEIGVTPFALLINSDGHILRGMPVENASAVREMFGPPAGESMPEKLSAAVANYHLKEVTP
jgi:hypothetical protein